MLVVVVLVGMNNLGGDTENLGEVVEVEEGVCQGTGNTMNRRTAREGEKRTKGIPALWNYRLIRCQIAANWN